MRASLYLLLALSISGCSISSVDTSRSVAVSAPLVTRLSKISEDPVVYQITGGKEPVFLTKITRCDGRSRQQTGFSWRGLFAKFEQVSGSTPVEGLFRNSPASKTLVSGRVDGEPIELIAISTNERCAEDLILWSFATTPKELQTTFDELAAELLWREGASR